MWYSRFLWHINSSLHGLLKPFFIHTCMHTKVSHDDERIFFPSLSWEPKLWQVNNYQASKSQTVWLYSLYGSLIFLDIISSKNTVDKIHPKICHEIFLFILWFRHFWVTFESLLSHIWVTFESLLSHIFESHLSYNDPKLSLIFFSASVRN